MPIAIIWRINLAFQFKLYISSKRPMRVIKIAKKANCRISLSTSPSSLVEAKKDIDIAIPPKVGMFLLESLFSFFLDFEKLFLMNLREAKFKKKEIKIATNRAR